MLGLLDGRKYSRQLTNEMRVGLNITISFSPVRRRLIAAGLHGEVATKKPLLRPHNEVKRQIYKATPRLWN